VNGCESQYHRGYRFGDVEHGICYRRVGDEDRWQRDARDLDREVRQWRVHRLPDGVRHDRQHATGWRRGDEALSGLRALAIERETHSLERAI
jgi:hypothetical protein